MVEQELSPSRERAKKSIMAGLVLVNDVPLDKPGSLVDRQAKIILKGNDMPYVSEEASNLKLLSKRPGSTWKA